FLYRPCLRDAAAGQLELAEFRSLEGRYRVLVAVLRGALLLEGGLRDLQRVAMADQDEQLAARRLGLPLELRDDAADALLNGVRAFHAPLGFIGIRAVRGQTLVIDLAAVVLALELAEGALPKVFLDDDHVAEPAVTVLLGKAGFEFFLDGI